MITAYIGMGANLPSEAGTPQDTLVAAAQRLERLGRVACRSSLYSTAPVGNAEQPRFVNAVVELETDLSPLMLLEGLLGIERTFGRDRSAGVRNGPRTLDLDILLYGDVVVSAAVLEIPHPRLAERAFVLVPLNEIASNVVVAPLGRSVKELLESLRGGGFETDAVLPLENDVWRAGPWGDGGVCPGRDSEGDADGAG